MSFNVDLYNRKNDLLYSYKIFNDTINIVKKKNNIDLVFKAVLNNESQKNALVSIPVLVRRIDSDFYDKKAKEELEKLKENIINLLIVRKFGVIPEPQREKIYEILKENAVISYSFI